MASPCIDIALQLEWYKIRDMLFPQTAPDTNEDDDVNDEFYEEPNISLALELAASCRHPDAVWLTKVCAGKNVTTKEDAQRVFSSLLGENDARALCFAFMLDCPVLGDPVALLRKSALLGCAFAQAWMASLAKGEDEFKFAELAAAQGERDGFSTLAWCYQNGTGCEADSEASDRNFFLASEHGHVRSMINAGYRFLESDARRWKWWGRAAGLGLSYTFLSTFTRQVDLYNAGSGSTAVMSEIGRALRGRVNEGARSIFSTQYYFDSLVGPAKQAIAFHEAQIKACRKAVDEWTKVALRLRVVKDVRIVIAKLIWDSREEDFFYDVDHDNIGISERVCLLQ